MLSNKYIKISFEHDLKNNFNLLMKKINNKKILVIGGAGSIGVNYVKQVLKFKPSSLTITVSGDESNVGKLFKPFFLRIGLFSSSV